LEITAGIALTFSELVTALVGWVVAKLRGHDPFDEVMREAEAEAVRHRSGFAFTRVPSLQEA
jgi:hypothetical protein